jgi:hypothetical protein
LRKIISIMFQLEANGFAFHMSEETIANQKSFWEREVNYCETN